MKQAEKGSRRVYACRNALVTGGASGIGRAVSKALCERGVRVFIGDIDLTRATDVAKELAQDGRRAEALRLDVSTGPQVAAAFADLRERCDGLDLVVNGAAVLGDTVSVEDMTDEQWRRVLAVNLDGTFYCCR